MRLAPVFPLEAVLDDEEMFTVGPLVRRSAHIPPEGKPQAYEITALTDLERYFKAQPPEAILLSLEDRFDGFWADNPGSLEVHLCEYAEAHSYIPVELLPGFGEGAEILWVKKAERLFF